MGGLRTGPRAPYRGSAHKGPNRSVPGAAVPPELHSEGRRYQAPACDHRARRQGLSSGLTRGSSRGRHEDEARRFWDAMRERLRAFSLSLHPEKTRLIPGSSPGMFGRFAARNRELRGLGKPETFKFLGFVLICAKSRRGVFQLRRKSRGDRMGAKLREVKEALRQRMHVPVPEVGKCLGQIVAGYFAYHAVPTNSPALHAFRYRSIANKTYGTVSADRQIEMSGLEFVEGLVSGTLPLNTMAETLGYDIVEVAKGRVVATALPHERHRNPAGTVHGGLAATLLDSCMGLAIQSTLKGHRSNDRR